MIEIFNKKGFLVKYFNYALAFMVVGNVYTIEAISVGCGELLLMLFMSFLCLGLKEVRLSKSGMWYLLFLLYSFLVTMINVVFIPEMTVMEPVKRMLRDFYYIVLIFVFARQFFVKEHCLKAINFIALALCCYIFAQAVFYYVFGQYLPGVFTIPGLTSFDWMEDKYLSMGQYLGYYRISGFLREPAHCVQFLVLPLAISLLTDGWEKNWLAWLIISAMFVSTSVNGIVLLFVIISAYILKDANILKVKMFMRVLMLSVLSVLILFVLYENFEFVSGSIDRLKNMFSGIDGSSNLRILRGWAFFFEMPLVGQIFGSGFGTFLEYRDAMHIWTVFEIVDVEYMASLPYLFVSAGIVGMFFLIMAVILQLKDKSYVNKVVFLVFIVLCFSSSIYSSEMHVLMLCFSMFGNFEEEVDG